MLSGLEQGAVISCLDLPLLMELLIQVHFRDLRSRQLYASGWLYADDIAECYAVALPGTPISVSLPQVQGALDSYKGGRSPEEAHKCHQQVTSKIWAEEIAQNPGVLRASRLRHRVKKEESGRRKSWSRLQPFIRFLAVVSTLGAVFGYEINTEKVEVLMEDLQLRPEELEELLRAGIPLLFKLTSVAKYLGFRITASPRDQMTELFQDAVNRVVDRAHTLPGRGRAHRIRTWNTRMLSVLAWPAQVGGMDKKMRSRVKKAEMWYLQCRGLMAVPLEVVEAQDFLYTMKEVATEQDLWAVAVRCRVSLWLTEEEWCYYFCRDAEVAHGDPHGHLPPPYLDGETFGGEPFGDGLGFVSFGSALS
jgi:hypothetical protein